MMSELRQIRRAPEIDPPLTPVHGTPIVHPSAWKVADFRTPADYTIELDRGPATGHRARHSADKDRRPRPRRLAARAFRTCRHCGR